jgi:methionyl-tRNA formyltransferase
MIPTNNHTDSRRLCQDKVLLSVCTMNWCDYGVTYARAVFPNLDVLLWDPGDPHPAIVDSWEGDWIISYRGDYIFKESVYKRAKKGALNFHPAPPKYRGLGSQHYAIFDGDESYGSTCHHLARSVDTGDIVDVANFKIAPGETASLLRLHVGASCLTQYLRILTDYIVPGKPLPVSPERWGDRLYKQSEINAWLERMRREMPDHPCMQ